MYSHADYFYDNTTAVIIPTEDPVIIPTEDPVTVTSEDEEMPTYVYYIIGIGSAALIIGLGLAICCCSYTCYVKCYNAKTKELPSLPKDPWEYLYSVSVYVPT